VNAALDTPAVPLQVVMQLVIHTAALTTRTPRAADHRAQGEALLVLARAVATQLFARPERYPCIRGASPAIEEVLLAPVHVNGKAMGTVWVSIEAPRRAAAPP
jgi:hypothetical protein